MILHTFSFLPGIGTKKEQQLWQQGIMTWDHFLQAKHIRGISKQKKASYDDLLQQAKQALFREDIAFLANLLPQTEHWRYLPWFLDDLVYLDIETTGLEHNARLLMVGLFDGYETHVFLEGINLERKSLEAYLTTKKMIVTFNGASFDLPFLAKWGIRFHHLHIDVKPLLQRLGIAGGLKTIETLIGIKRNKHLQHLTGGDVYLLWRKYLATGDEYFLHLLLEYNEQDVLSLKPLLFWAYRKLTEQLIGVSSFPTRVIGFSQVQEDTL